MLSIFSTALLVNLLQDTVNFLVNSPLPKILTPSFAFAFLAKLTSNINSSVTSVPSSKIFNCSTFTSAYFFAKIFDIIEL